MKITRSILGLAVCALAFASVAAQAAGIDVSGFVAAHGDIFASLAMLGFAGEITLVTPEEIKKKLEEISGEVRQFAEKAKADNGKLNDQTKESVDKVLVKQGELLARLQEVEQKQDRRGGGGIERIKTAGAEVVNSEEFKKYVADGNFKKGFNMPVKAVVNITSDVASAGDTVAPDRLQGIVAAPDRRMTVRDLITPGSTGSNLIQYVKETGFQNMAATVAEGAAKPKSDITFDLVSSAVVKIATYVKASTEILADAAMLQSYIDGRLRYMLSYVEETQLLKGSGVGNNLNGIYTQATGYAAPIVITARRASTCCASRCFRPNSPNIRPPASFCIPLTGPRSN